MITSIKDKFKHSNTTIAIPLTILIAVAMLIFASQDTASASGITPSKNIDISAEFNAATPEGVWSDGSTIWVVDKTNDQLVAYRLSDGEHLADKTIELASGNSKPRGIWSNTAIMWVADWDDTKLYAYDLDTGDRKPDRDINLANSNDAPRGITGQFTAIYVVDKDDTYVYAYSQTDGRRRHDLEFNLHGSNDQPWDIWVGGTHAWVSDFDDDRLYGYNAQSGDHDATVDLRTPLDNRAPRGIWADGETMWIVDADDKQLYAILYRHFRHTDDEIDISAVDTPQGIWTDGETMWVVDAGATPNPKLLAYRLSDGTRQSGKDTVLNSENQNPRGIWSDGTYVWVSDGDIRKVFAYELGGDDGETYPAKQFHPWPGVDYPKGIWSDGTVMYMASSGGEKVYAYEMADTNAQFRWDIKLDPENTDAAGIWSDGQTMWVLDATDAHVYAYDAGYEDSDYSYVTVNRKRSEEFRPSPYNGRLGAGFTGHGLRFWMTDPDDDLLYAYGWHNTPASFGQTHVEFQIHDTIGGESYVGTVPTARDADGDTLSYGIGGRDVGRFTFDRETRAIYTAAGTPNFTKGNSYSLTVEVTDSKSRLDGSDPRPDDVIGITVNVWANSNPRFNIADDSEFYVDENVAPGSAFGELNVVDPDGDTLTYSVSYHGPVYPTLPFTIEDGQLKLKANQALDYENRWRYQLWLRVKDGKNLDGLADNAWDDWVRVVVKVVNVDEPGAVTLSSAQPVVGAEIVATPTDPDGVVVDDDFDIDWIVERGADPVSGPWTETLDTGTSTYSLKYTPSSNDAGHYLQFTARYLDWQGGHNRKTAQAVSANPVASEAATNHSPTFTDGASTTREIAENSTAGAIVATAVDASDDDTDDTLTYGLAGPDAALFTIDTASGQISLGANTQLDYEAKASYSVTVQVRDSKDADGNADTAWDAYISVTINVTNVDEAGAVVLSSDTPEVNVPLTASLTDPDGGVSNLAWQWQRADANPSDTWNDISGATSEQYTPTDDDVDKFLRAQASYDDATGSGKQVTGDVSNAVRQAMNGAPQFIEGSTSTRSVAENASIGTPVGAAVAATDPDGDALTYALADTVGSNPFVINMATGEITVAASQSLDYESSPTIALTVQVSDSKDASHNPDDAIDDGITVTVSLTNVDEPGYVKVKPGKPKVGTSLTANLDDPDGSITATQWQWSKSANGSTSWEDIDGASTDSYTPTENDSGMYLRASVEYTDGEGAGKSARGVTRRSVPGDPIDQSQQATPPERSTHYQQCLDDQAAGRTVECGTNEFADYRVEPDGGYTINWAVWDEEHPDVTGYTIYLIEFVYTMYYEGDNQLDGVGLANIYKSCEFADGQWSCEGHLDSNSYEDMNGNPTEMRIVAHNVDQIELSSTLDAPGRWVSEGTFQRWSGDATDPNNDPEAVTFTVVKSEMDLYGIDAHGGDGGRGNVLIIGSNGFDERTH